MFYGERDYWEDKHDCRGLGEAAGRDSGSGGRRLGAPDRCTDWTDFAERLEWVVRIMPGYDIVTLDAPAVKDLGSIQFQQDNGRLEASMITADTVPGSGGLDLRLRALGWRVTEGPGAPHVEWLYGPFSSCS